MVQISDQGFSLGVKSKVAPQNKWIVLIFSIISFGRRTELRRALKKHADLFEWGAYLRGYLKGAGTDTIPGKNNLVFVEFCVIFSFICVLYFSSSWY